METTAALVIPRIFAAIDDRRFADLNALYAEDVHATTAVGHLSGRAQLVSTLQAIHEPIPVLQHLVTGVIVDEDGDDADVRANVTAFFGDDQHQPILEGSSIWRGRLRRSNGHWQIAQVDIESVWNRGMSRITSPTVAG
jgi:SnoaL-like protein